LLSLLGNQRLRASSDINIQIRVRENKTVVSEVEWENTTTWCDLVNIILANFLSYFQILFQHAASYVAVSMRKTKNMQIMTGEREAHRKNR
jgi:hypothetical protein